MLRIVLSQKRPAKSSSPRPRRVSAEVANQQPSRQGPDAACSAARRISSTISTRARSGATGVSRCPRPGNLKEDTRRRSSGCHRHQAAARIRLASVCPKSDRFLSLLGLVWRTHSHCAGQSPGCCSDSSGERGLNKARPLLGSKPRRLLGDSSGERAGRILGCSSDSSGLRWPKPRLLLGLVWPARATHQAAARTPRASLGQSLA